MTKSMLSMRSARKLFVVQGKSLQEISKILKISFGTIRRWCAREKWTSLRLNYHKNLNEAESKLPEIYKGLIDKASKSLDVQEVEAVLKLRKILKAKGGE